MNKTIPKRLLCIVNSMEVGGAETFLIKNYRALDRTKYQMDFYCMSSQKGYYEKEIILLGGRIYHSIPKSRNILKAFLALKNVVKNEKYFYVMRVSQHSLATIDLLAAKFGGARVLVQRSSNADSSTIINRILHKMFKWLPIMIPTLKIAPSTEAAEYTFGRNSIRNGKATIVKNAIAVDKFLFNSVKRDKMRQEMGIEGKFVIGHVGRFSNQKNHEFLIDIFGQIVKKHNGSVLILVGNGELEGKIKNKVKNLGLIDNVIFTGIRSDIPDILMAMDVFLFPSFFEGMPNTVIEAQATGLPCIISDSITKETNICGLVKYISLNTAPGQWAKIVLESYNLDRGQKRQKEYINQKFKENGYDIKIEADNFMKLLFNANDSL